MFIREGQLIDIMAWHTHLRKPGALCSQHEACNYQLLLKHATINCCFNLILSVLSIQSESS
ncbi:Os08g0249400 [Oryza sativa Japonica Group]|uniref:Uncharacterized protein n=2 Tax=Oryza sativa subsp. japonica TaxID=39947 RepID=A0A8J8YN97_ORYSJ|nr:hypothetical protein OsJ_26614 [Oryza sativa Japonica Group]BAT04552.1 Os08g0249400 [Oryza sativa Japonica Group]